MEESPFVDELIVSDSSAAFDGPYGEKPRRRIVAWFIEMLMMLPRRRGDQVRRGRPRH